MRISRLFALAALAIVVVTSTPSNAQSIKVDNSDGCGSARTAVEVGRDMIRRDRSYRESDKWFQDRLAKLQTCIAEIPKRQAQYQAEHKRWLDSKLNRQRFANSALIVMAALFPVVIFLSYAQSAGAAGNGAMVRFRDWKGQPLFIWLPLAAAALVNFLGVHAVPDHFEESTPATELPRIVGGFTAFAMGVVALFPLWHFLRDGLWSMLKGVVILTHYLFASHPAQQHLPAEATEAIAKGSFGHAIRTHDVDYKGFWRELVTPAFVRRHKLERAEQVKAQLDADTGILKSAIERESTRAAYLDKRDNG